LDFARVASAIDHGSESGMRYRAERLQIVATGVLDPDGADGSRFRITGWPQSYPAKGMAPIGTCRLQANLILAGGGPRLERMRLLSPDRPASRERDAER
jgi:hypothetical protein